MDDLDFKSVRKNFNIISVLILLLAFSNAEISEINFLNIKLSLEGAKLYIGIYALYLYFVWRYLTKVNLPGDFWGSFRVYFLESNEGVKKKYSFENMKTRFFQEDSTLERLLTGDKPAQIFDLKAIQIAPDKPREIRLSQHFYKSLSQEEKDNGEHENFSVMIEITITRFYRLRKLVWFSLRYDKFGDYLFPIILLIINILFMLFNTKWQGSFNQILLNSNSN